MRKPIAVFVVLIAAGFACNVSAKTAVHYSADQSDCPPGTTPAEQTGDAPDPSAAPAAAPTRNSSRSPIKSSRSNSSRGKWKALLPGTIK